MPLVRPLTTQLPEDALIVQVPAPPLAVTMIDVAPATAATDTVADWLAVTTPGAAGRAIGVPEVDASDTGELLPPLRAVATNAYAVLSTRPVTVQAPDAPLMVQVCAGFPSVAAITIDWASVTADAIVTSADPLPATTVGVPGCAGTGGGATGCALVRTYPSEETATNRPMP